MTDLSKLSNAKLIEIGEDYRATMINSLKGLVDKTHGRVNLVLAAIAAIKAAAAFAAQMSPDMRERLLMDVERLFAEGVEDAMDEKVSSQ